MPIYAYRCSSCGFQKDHLQKISDPLLTDCPQCGKPDYKKMLTAAGFQLKGSGWYATDFKGGGSAAASDAGKKSAEGGKEAGSGAGGAGADGGASKDSAPAKESATKESSSTAAAGPAGT